MRRRLDGLPLAIELAAARMRMLQVGQVAARLDDIFSVLDGGNRSAPARHETLRATLDWSGFCVNGKGVTVALVKAGRHVTANDNNTDGVLARPRS